MDSAALLPAMGAIGPDVESYETAIRDDESQGMSRNDTPEDEAVESDVEDDNPDLQRDRHENDQRLKGRFENIFEKYARDFTRVGDEIDIESGEIVVDNGHLENMQHEVDPGQSQSLQFVKNFAEELEHEDEFSGSSSDEEDGASEGTISESDAEGMETDEDEALADTSIEKLSAAERQSGSRATPEQTATFAIDPLLQELSYAAFAADQLQVPAIPPHGEGASGDRETQHTASFDVMSIPAVQKSMRDFKSKTSASRSVDPDAIQALGANIAHQIAKFMGGRKPKAKSRNKNKRKDPIWDFPDLPAFKRRRTEASKTDRPQFQQLSTLLSPNGKIPKEPLESIWAPQHHPRQIKLRIPKMSEPAAQTEYGDTAEVSAENDALGSGPHPAADEPVDSNALSLKECVHCHIKATTAWRSGPDGCDLCNACGMYWYRYELMRPVRLATPEELSGDEADEKYRDGSHYSANTSRRLIKPGNRHSRFTIEEDALIIKLKEIDHLNWERIGRHFPGRSHYGVQCRYAKILHKKDSAGRDALIEQGFTFEEPLDAEVERALSEEQDELLVQLRVESELDWASIAERLPGKTPEWVEARYNLLVKFPEAPAPAKPKRKRPNPVYAKAPKNHSRRYSKEEDEQLIKLREVDKLPWEILAEDFTERTWLSLQKRYVRTLAQRHRVMREGGDDPYTHLFLQKEHDDDDIRMGPAGRKRLDELLAQRRADDEILTRLKDVEGLSFGEIAEKMPGRTVQSLINRYDYLREVNDSMNVTAPTSPGVVEQQASEQGGEQGTSGLAPGTWPKKRRGKYTAAEVELIVKLRTEQSMGWSLIALRLPGRTAEGIERTYYQHMQDDRSDAPEGSAAFTGAEVTMSGAEDDELSGVDPTFAQVAPDGHQPSTEAGREGTGTTDGPVVGPPAVISATSTVERTEVFRDQPPHKPGDQIRTHAKTNSSQRPAAVSETDQANKASSRHLPKQAKPGSKYSRAEHDLLVKLRLQGQNWAEIATHLPGRTPSSLSGYWWQHRKHISVPTSVIQRPSTKRTLLRQALDKGVRRIADGGKAPIQLPDLTSRTHGGHPGPMNLFNTLLRGGATVAPAPGLYKTPTKVMDTDEVEFDFAKLGDGPLEHSPQKSLPAKPPSLLPSLLSAASRNDQVSRNNATDPSPRGSVAATPTKSHRLGTTTVMTQPAAESVLESIECEAHTTIAVSPVLPETPSRQAARQEHVAAQIPDWASGPVPSTPPAQPAPTPVRAGIMTFPADMMPNIAACMPIQAPTSTRPEVDATAVQAVASPVQAVPPVPVGSRFPAASPVTAASPSGPTTPMPARTPVAAFTPLRASTSYRGGTPLPASTPFTAAPAPAFYNTPARYIQQVMPYFVAPQENMLPASPVRSQIEEQPHPDEVVSEPSLEAGNATSAKRGVPSRVNHVPPPVRSTPDLSESEDVVISDTITKARVLSQRSPPVSPGASLGDGIPPLSWNDLITMALKSSPVQRLDIREIYSYLEVKFPYFKACGQGWKRTLQAHLARSSDFDKVSDYANTWTFLKHEVVVEQPKRRGPGRSRKRVEANVAGTGGKAAESSDPPSAKATTLDKTDTTGPASSLASQKAKGAEVRSTLSTDGLLQRSASASIMSLISGASDAAPGTDPPQKKRGPPTNAERFARQAHVGAFSSPMTSKLAKTPPTAMLPPSDVPKKKRGRPPKRKDADSTTTKARVPDALPSTTSSSPTMVPVSTPVTQEQSSATDIKEDTSLTQQVADGLDVTMPSLPSGSLGLMQEHDNSSVPASDSLVTQYDIPLTSTDPLQHSSTVQYSAPSSTDPLQQIEDQQRPSKTNLTSSTTHTMNLRSFLSSDITREPVSSPAVLQRRPKVFEVKRSVGERGHTSENEVMGQSKPRQPTAMPRSSSPLFPRTREQSPRVVYRRAGTPAYPGSLADRIKQGGLAIRRPAPTPILGGVRCRANSEGRAGSVKGSVKTPVVAVDSSEDELAL